MSSAQESHLPNGYHPGQWEKFLLIMLFYNPKIISCLIVKASYDEFAVKLLEKLYLANFLLNRLILKPMNIPWHHPPAVEWENMAMEARKWSGEARKMLKFYCTVPQKVKRRITIWPSNSTLRFIPPKLKTDT